MCDDQLDLMRPASYDVDTSQLAADKLFASGRYTTLLWLTLDRLAQGPVTGYDWWRANCEVAGREENINNYAPRLSDLVGIGCARKCSYRVPIRHGASSARPYEITDLGRAMLRERSARRATAGGSFGPPE
jgi:hypothetical protein